jgi:hypothetical protein
MLDQYGPWGIVVLVYAIGGFYLYGKGRWVGRKEGYKQGYLDRPTTPQETVTKKDLHIIPEKKE